MPYVTIVLNSINAEKLAAMIPPRVDFNMNLTLPSSEPVRRDNQYMIPFVFTISSNPPIVHITIKGNVIVISEKKDEIDQLEDDLKKKKQIPPHIINTVFLNMFAETVLLSRSLGIPPPIPIPQQFTPSGQKDVKEHGHGVVI